ncbi:putative transmembrane protein DDB_G0267530 [Ptychodera flava]|uniref:putative transmembrane protein DDB_G0267530 n=1 Tax=Ptychodera flava TaxID=63121 RepID=UPI00396A9E19
MEMESKRAEASAPPSDPPPPYPQQGAYPPSQPTGYPPQAPYSQQYPPPQATPYSQPTPQTTTTTSNVVVTAAPQSTVIIRSQRLNSPNACDIVGLVLAIINTFCCFVPLGLVSVVLSGFAFAFRMEGKHESADRLSKISVVLSIIGFILVVVIVVVVVVVVITHANSLDYDY